MTHVNQKRVWLGALVGFVVWSIWSMVIGLFLVGPRYPEAQAAGYFLKEPRYGFFPIAWFVILFLLSYILAWLYAGLRATYGAGPKTALAVGILVGFAAGFPGNFAMAAWLPASRVFPLGWMLDMWVGAVLAAFVAAWLYRD